MNSVNLFWNASAEELKKGFVFDLKKQCYFCIFCDASYEKGIIYQENGVLEDRPAWAPKLVEE